MSIVLGIDVGISTTKIVGIKDGQLQSTIRIKATDPVTSLYGAFGKYLNENDLKLTDIAQVMLTGVGSDYIKGPIFGLPTKKVSEFISDGLGARFESDLDRMIVVSMGTGTTLVRCEGDDISHFLGIAMGGGTLAGLSRLLLDTDDINYITTLAENGDLSNIDLQIGDICTQEIPGLPAFATASLFGKAKKTVAQEDIALGIICTVVQTIASATVIAGKGLGIRDFVMIGNLSRLPQCREVFDMIENLYDVHFHIPTHSDFSTAIGAALSYSRGNA